MLALARSVSDLAFNDAFSWGPTTYCHSASAAAAHAPSQLAARACRGAENGAGNALVAEADRTRRTVVARVLRNAGYAVTFAVTAEDARRSPSVRTWPGGDQRRADAAGATHRAASARGGQQRHFILCCAPRDLKSVREDLDELSGIAAVDGYAAPENVLFASNELRAAASITARAAFAVRHDGRLPRAGRERDDLGFTYNVSAGGIYVRTLAPPDDDVTWVELKPPRTERLVRLVVKIAWRRRFNFNENATVPPGFGAQIVDGARADLDAWTDGCATMSTSARLSAALRSAA